MKKCKCGFETSNQDYKICPLCGELLFDDNTKRPYKMGIRAEEEFTMDIEMTYEEAQIVNRVLNELNSYSEGWCGRCWIEFKEK